MFSRIFSNSTITEEKLVANPSLTAASAEEPVPGSEPGPDALESALEPGSEPGPEPGPDAPESTPTPVSESVTDVKVPENANKCGVYCTIM